MTTVQTLIVGSVLVLTSLAGAIWLLARELLDADRRWEAEREAYVAARTAEMAARWEAHVTDAIAAATDVPDYVPTEWEDMR